MGLFDKVKKAIGGPPSTPPAQSGQQKAGQKQGGGQRGQGGGQRGQGGGQRGQGGQGGQASGSGRRRGSRGGRGRGGQGGGQGNQTTTAAQQRDEGADATTTGASGQRRRRRGGRGRGGSSGGQSGTTRTVTRSNAAQLKEQQQKEGGGSARQGSGQRSGQGQRRKSGSSSRSRSGGRRRERARRGSASSGSHRRVLDANERPKEPVKKQILINASDPNEIRVAIREQQKVVEVYVERKGKRSLAGNIYKGRVQNVLRGMEAAFVDIGLERNGFLYVDEITPAAADSDQIMQVSMVTEVQASDAASAQGPAPTTEPVPADEAEATAPTPAAEAMQQAAAESDEIIDIDDAMEEEDREAAEAAAAEEGDAKAADTKPKGRGRARIQNKKKIQELLKPGQEILCQVVKDPMGTKGSRLTTQYSLAGRYLVYVPDGEGLGVSRRLEEAERNRLRDIVRQFELPWGGGLIVRTAAEGALEEDIAKDLQLLLRLHEQLMDKAGQARAPKLLYNEADLSLRIIRDLMNDEVEEVLVDDERQFQRIMNYLKRTSPILSERVRMHEGQRPLFESYGVDDAIRSTLSRRADLQSGGYLIIDKTEAFHVIDVNTGRNVGTASLEETITKTNMEAAEEVVRQLRLRDLGGIIVVDFIDMNLMKNRDMVLEHFRKELSKDRTKTYLVEISPLGLVEMTRQNVSEGVREILTSTCRSCEGRGVQLSAETHAIEVERALAEMAAGLDGSIEAIAIEAQPEVARALAGNQGRQLELNKRAGRPVRVLPDPDLAANTFALRATGAAADIEAIPELLQRGSKHKVTIESADPACEADGLTTIDGVLVTIVGAGDAVGEERTILIAACSGTRAFATLVKPARRRRRRGGRGRRKATVAVGAAGAEDAAAVEDEEDVDDELEDGEYEEGEEFDDGLSEAHHDDVASAEDDGGSEIPERLVMLDEGAHDEDEDEDDDEEGDDESDEPDDSDESEDPDDDFDADAEDELDSDSDDVDEESFDEGPPLVRRLPDDDRDEPSIDVEGSDDLLEARGVSVPSAASASAAPAATSGTAGSGQRRRRRGSRGGRNRNRNRPGGGQGGSSTASSDG